MKIIVDRTEGEYIIAELPDGSFAQLPAVFVPGAKDGDVISIEIDKEETDRRSENIKKRMDRLFNK